MSYSTYFQSLKDCISFIENNYPQSLQSAISVLTNSKVIFTIGIGKSSFVAGKFASVLKSIGKNAQFIHPTDAIHGDMGCFDGNSVVVVFSKSGVGSEYEQICKHCYRENIPIILITNSLNSPLEKYCSSLITIPITTEDPFFNSIPSVSFTVNTIITDLLVFGLIESIGISKEQYRKNHPAGQIGYLLTLQVKDLMHLLQNVGIVKQNDSLKSAIISATQFPLGCVCVCNDVGNLIGIITDGDIRRYLVDHSDVSTVNVESIMNNAPITITADASLKDAASLMEGIQKKVSVLPVVENNQLKGIIRLHDIMSVSF
jgi:arabinose-5-phosphate isomerase